MKLTSPAFTHNKPLPAKYTCDGEDLSPPLSLAGTPKGVMALALVMDDPDAPMGTFDHWVAWNIPPTQLEILEGQKIGVEGMNSYGTYGYRGPCPPRGPVHHYHVRIYALDASLSLKAGASKRDLEKAMQGHILGQAELIGTYQR